MHLSDLQIRKAKQKDKPYRLTDGLGLHLAVKPTGSKLWQFRYRYMGKEKLLSLGPYPAVSLADARRKRDDAKRLLVDGIDPSVRKHLEQIDAQVKARMTFKEVADEYYESLVDRGLAAATLRKKRWHIEDLAKPLHNRPIDQITAAELLHLLKPIERSGRRETAKKLRATISAIFRLAMVTMRAPADPSAALNDALLAPKVKGRAAIIDENEFGQLLRRLDDYTGWPVIPAAMKFQILTCTRPSETRGARKNEFDLDARTWTIPPTRMKMRREHKVPLSRQAFSIVMENWSAIDDVELVFPSLISNRKLISENAFNTVLRRLGYSGDEVTAHGFRVTASTILNSREHNPDVIEAMLAHQDTNVIRRTYNRTTYWDQRVELMQVWADLCDQFRSL
ncbi:tyrosine-type recombinase/integrase [Psychromarinibacter sp. C21-152]|uniref:Tyrosine-type recombinase/integrase n=1 Tax=Psychromarinibacter sediminicola TaxID=3033385 RepID=A0AAE3T8V8_9RHOB|nr:integrase arm-type DNA-binding domain-containing protein [Psychromarinibacter sediminicola]MDF0601148.1 tyrosine-type recombinase/integrase [Psychromarinibacter sediminicola]